MRALGVIVGVAVLLAANFGACSAKVITISSKDGATGVTAALGKAAPGDVVKVGAGTFLLNDTLVVPSKVVLSGAGRDATIFQWASPTKGTMVLCQGITSSEITGMTLDGGGKGMAAHGIVADSSTYLNLHSIGIRNFAPTGDFGPIGIYFSQAVTDSTIADTVITDVGVGAEYGSGMRIAHGSSRNVIVRNRVERTGRGGILANDDSTDLVISGNVVSGSGGEGLGIELWGGCGGSIVEDNVIDHWLSVDSSDGSAIRRNVISDKSGVFKYAGLELVASKNVIFTDNTVDDGTMVGLSVSNDPLKEHLLFAYNTYRLCSQWGGQIQGDKEGVRGLYLYKESFLETRAKHASARYPGDAGHGLRINGNTDGIVLDGVRIEDNGRMGIQILGPGVNHVAVVNSTISRNGGSVYSAPALGDVMWENNVVALNKGNRAPNPKGFATPELRAAIAGPTTARVGEKVSFQNASMAPTSAEGASCDVLWDLGVGLPVTTQVSSVTYAAPGRYRVLMVAWDKAGRASIAEHWVDVVVRP